MKKIIVIIIVIVILAGLYFFVYPIFNTIERNDPLPASPTGDSRTSEDPKGAQEIVENSQTAQSSRGPYGVKGTVGHPASGAVRVIDSKTIRYENFETINGPDLYVYLSKDLEANDFVDLGEIRGTKGNINYEIPDTINVEEYTYVLTWCKAFGVLFNYAQINL